MYSNNFFFNQKNYISESEYLDYILYPHVLKGKDKDALQNYYHFLKYREIIQPLKTSEFLE